MMDTQVTAANRWQDQKVLVLGAARQGLALARYLSQLGACVTLNDQRTPEALDEVRHSFEMQADSAGTVGVDVSWVLGSHPLELLDEADLVCLSGGVPLTLPIVTEALARGLPLSNDSQIFMENVPCPVIGITGSAGKTTTTTLVGELLKPLAGKDLPGSPRRVWVGGNIGLPLIDHLHEIQNDDLVVLELSSFQLEQMTRMPQVGAVLNITPNHLDRHGTLEAYTAAKTRLLSFQNPEDVAVLGMDDPGARKLSGEVCGRLITFGMQRPPEGSAGTYLEGGRLWLNDGHGLEDLMAVEEIPLRGFHNLMNVLAACALVHGAGLPLDHIAGVVAHFRGVPHRLEWVRSWKGTEWYNDSIATAPERTLAAIESFDGPLVVLLGGRDKDLPWEALAARIRERVDHVVAFGEASGIILAALGSWPQGERPYSVVSCEGLVEAVHAAAEAASEGDVVLLSPGGTSFDEFKDFEERGMRFKEWVHQLS
jgi:UDP-N-acetylmuramoylalanine--D-glutamate ligase